MLITVGGKNKGVLGAGDVVEVVGFDYTQLVARVRGTQEPSSETPMHWLIYERFSRVNAVVHAHDDSVVRDRVKARRLNLKFTERAHPYGTVEQAREVVAALSNSDYVVILNHGVVSVGGSLKEAVRRVEEVCAL
jgi:L-fuculose-phosphate aldolase